MKRIWIFVRGLYFSYEENKFDRQRNFKKATRLLKLLGLRYTWRVSDTDEYLINVMNCGKLRKIIIRRALRGEAFRLVEN